MHARQLSLGPLFDRGAVESHEVQVVRSVSAE